MATPDLFAREPFRPERPSDPLLRGADTAYRFCGGTTDNCSWRYSGSTGYPVRASASQSDVVVGVEVAYADPSQTPPVAPITPVGGSPGCPPSEVCRHGARVDPPPPPIQVPGAVYGITKLYCADAEQVASGDNAPTSTVDTNLGVPTGTTGVLTGKLQAPTGAFALDGFQLYYGSDGATQIAASYRPFAHNQGTSTRSLTGFLPSQASKSSTSRILLGCYNSQGDLYLSGADQAETSSYMALSVGGFTPQLGSLGLECTDYTDVFQMPDSKKVACCLGTGSGCWWGQYFPQTEKCDDIMMKYCRPLCSGGTCADPACGCLGSPLAADGVAQCFDARCADDTGAYRTRNMKQSDCKGKKSLTCKEWAALGGGTNVAKGVPLPSGCGGPPDTPSGGIIEWLEKNPSWAVVFIVFVILLAFALMPSGGGGGARRVPKLPPGALPTLPPLTTV